MEIQTITEIASHISEDEMDFLINSIVTNAWSLESGKKVKGKKDKCQSIYQKALATNIKEKELINPLYRELSGQKGVFFFSSTRYNRQIK